jgi:DsbC/DsbD-like thiol-disulfide interchange protein
MLYGIPFPGAFVTDEDGVVIAKSFHDTYKKRDSPEILIDAALGRIELSAEAPTAVGGDEEVRVTAAIHGGSGTIRQGIVRHLVVRFELRDGLHIYGEPVPEGMVATRVTLRGPSGLVVQDPILPPTEPLRLGSTGAELRVWSGSVDIAVPFYPTGELASEVRPLDADAVTLEVEIRYQACDDETCLLPRTEKLTFELPLDVIDVPRIPLHMGHGQREGDYDGKPGLRRLMLRKIRSHPLGFLRFIGKHLRLELAARARAARSRN